MRVRRGGAIARDSATRDATATLAREQPAHVDIERQVDQASPCPLTGAIIDVSVTMAGDTQCPKQNMLLYVAVAISFSAAAGGAPGKASQLADEGKHKHTHGYQ